MNSLIIYKSIEHKNTERIANQINQVLKGDIMNPEEVNVNELDKYDLIGFGSGIFYGKFHKNMVNLVDNLGNFQSKRGFVFSTSGQGKADYNNSLKNKLESKGFDIIGSFACKGFDTYGPFKIFGGIAKGRPNESDMTAAKKFAAKLLKDK
ncbi:flavodoxin family protein [Clostridium sp. JNZ X4-2]